MLATPRLGQRRTGCHKIERHRTRSVDEPLLRPTSEQQPRSPVAPRGDR
ncbi:putative leucine-rich repeat extensin-like protein 7 [Iris pallida]|uniref:Leucine-rich repeat extensin-like protein 7 n=1 Tax=Iris pallida TaxID=29817 RepID=A0AAX6HZR4_IRIPA|nr:putative leucine-rich repeat extensin-like protein 7 [Iris pallida]